MMFCILYPNFNTYHRLGEFTTSLLCIGCSRKTKYGYVLIRPNVDSRGVMCRFCKESIDVI